MSEKFKFHQGHINVLKKFINVSPSLGFHKDYVSVWSAKDAVSAKLKFKDEENYSFEPLGLKDAGKLLDMIDYCGNDYNVEVIDSQTGEKSFALKVSNEKNNFRYILNTIGDGTNVIPECQYDLIEEKFKKVSKEGKTTSFNISMNEIIELFNAKKIVGSEHFIISPIIKNDKQYIKFTIGRMEADETYDSSEQFVENVNFVNHTEPTKFKFNKSILIDDDYTIEYSNKVMKLTAVTTGLVYYIFATLSVIR